MPPGSLVGLLAAAATRREWSRRGRVIAPTASASFLRASGAPDRVEAAFDGRQLASLGFTRRATKEASTTPMEGTGGVMTRGVVGRMLAEVAAANPDRVAIVSSRGDRITFGALLAHAATLADALRAAAGNSRGGADGASLRGERVAVSAVPSPEYVSAIHAAWMCGAIVVPIARSHTREEVEYVLRDAGAAVLVTIADGDSCATPSDDFLPPALRATGVAAVETPPLLEGGCSAAVSSRPNVSSSTRAAGAAPDEGEVGADDGALIIYTSGTTGQPKGVLHTHGTLAAQCAALISAWAWNPDDVIYHALPLHHIHGIVNAWMCAHAVGACVEFAAGGARGQFAPRTAWSRLRGEFGADDVRVGDRPRITVFMGVPTMYVMMLRSLGGMRRTRPEVAAASAAAAARLRLTVSGSAACPVPVLREWAQVTGGTVLLERYGMTEIGMALSNPLTGERRAGTVGHPLPGVEVKCVSLLRDEGEASDGGFEDAEEGPGELLVRGPMVFKEYWGRPDATAESFDGEGFFRTGDTVIRESDGYWRILGRTSVDIIKCGGFKVSALEVEAKLLEHPRVAEVAVFGVPDEAYGEVVAATVVMRESTDDGGDGGDVADESGIGAWARERMSPYKAPQRFYFCESIPRNAMGKVNKKDLRAQFAGC